MTPTSRLACLSILLPALFLTTSPARGAVPPAEPAVHSATTTLGPVGFQQRVSDIMKRQADADAAGVSPIRDAEEKENEHPRPDRSHLPQDPGSPLDTGTPARPNGASSASGINSVMSPQTVGLSFTGATLTGINPTLSFPPDCMGAVGPSQYVVFVNGRLVTFNKTTGVADGVLNANPDVFFGPVRNGSSTSDPRIRYDRLSGRWFLVIINVSTPNRILLAVSDAASASAITGGTVWSLFFIPIDSTPPTISSSCLADYPTLGVDANALYVGTNNFCPSFNGSDGYVIRKSSIMGAGPLVVTVFRSLCTAATAGPYTPQGVDNYDPAATEGYFIGADNVSFGRLQLRRVATPGGTPTVSTNIPITVSATNSPIPAQHLGNTGGNNGRIDALDDRLFAAHIRNGQLWTAHNIGVDNTGVVGSTSRDGSRWYHLNVPVGSGTPTIVESGTVFTASASNTTDQRNYIIPSVMVSGQGHAAIGFTTSGTSERINSSAAGRFVSDGAGTMQAATVITSSTTAYNPPQDTGAGNGARRWGDYTYTSVDPLDDMTLWTVGEFCDVTNSYGVRITKLVAPPPATPSALADITAGQSSVTLTLTGAAAGGSGFFDPGANLPGVPAFNHLSASITNGAATGTPPAVVSATYLTPSTVSLVLNATAATPSVGTEHYTITITNPDGQTAAAAIVRVANGGPPTVSIGSGPNSNEGNVGTKSFNFPVSLSSATVSPVTVRYQTSDGTATAADNDYTAAVDSLVLAAGQLSGTIHVTVIGDTKFEPNETFSVSLTSATGATLGASTTGNATIINDDAVPVVSIVSSAATVEGNSGSTPLAFAVSLSNASSSAVTVGWSTSDNSATTADNDYVAGSGTVSIPAGQTSGSASVDVVGDTKYENNEGFSVTLASPSGATLGNAVATGTITNDDVMPTLAIDSVQHLEGNSGTTLYRFTVTQSQVSGVITSVDWTTVDGTATAAGNDFQTAVGPLTIAAGSTSQTLDVLVNGDGVQEPDETFTVELSNPTSATITGSTGTGTITNDDATPLLAIGDVSALEGTGGLTPFRFVVTLSSPSEVPVSVQYQAVDGSAKLADTDYQPASGTLSFTALAVADTITVQVVADSCGEANETFTVALSSPVGAAISTGVGLGTIGNDDDVTPPAVAVLQPNGGEALGVDAVATLQWSATDSAGVSSVDLLLSRDGGATYPELIASGIPNSGLYFWTVTAPLTPTALLQVRAHDVGCNTASDVSDAAFAIDDHVSGVQTSAPVTVFALGPVQPNPSRGSVQFGYQLPRESRVRLSIVDVQGREMSVIVDGPVGVGRHAATWSGVTQGGQAPRGLYFVRYVAGGKVFSRRFALVR